jgi:hypothetical protein
VSNWTADELDAIGRSQELDIAPAGVDGSLWPYTTVWVVRAGDELIVRSYRGRTGRWFRHALAHLHGRVRAGGIERDVTFEEFNDADPGIVDDAYRAKYSPTSPDYVAPMISAAATAATLRLAPR